MLDWTSHLCVYGLSNIVAAEIHAHMRRVFDKIMRDPRADVVDRNSRGVHASNASVIVDIILDDKVFARNQRVAIAPVCRNAAGAEIPKLASGNGTSRSFDDNPVPTAVVDVQIGERDVAAFGPDDSRSHRAEHVEPRPRDVGNAV